MNASIQAKVICDSITERNARLTTMVVQFPRFLLPQFNTHRMFSRNSSSSRAIPVEKRILQVQTNPFVPDHWGKNKPGMQATQEITDTDHARSCWMQAIQSSIASAKEMQGLEVHKQLANRLLEPFAYQTVLVTATDWENFFHLRLHEDSQPEMQELARAMHEALRQSLPRLASFHLPFVSLEEAGNNVMSKLLSLSVARCARVSYDLEKQYSQEADEALESRLRIAGHFSPFEHQARAAKDDNYHRNFKGWIQHREINETPLHRNYTLYTAQQADHLRRLGFEISSNEIEAE